jgi:hypothetical protein
MKKGVPIVKKKHTMRLKKRTMRCKTHRLSMKKNILAEFPELKKYGFDNLCCF